MERPFRLTVLLACLTMVIVLPAVAGDECKPPGCRPLEPGDVDYSLSVTKALGVTVDGPWTPFFWPSGTADIPIDENPLTFTATNPVVMQITDVNINDDRFRVVANGDLLGFTSDPVNPGTGPFITDPDLAFHSVFFTSGEFRLCPGDYEIDLFDVLDQTEPGVGYIRVFTDPTSTCGVLEDIANLEAKADVFEAKADALEAKADALEAKADALDAQVVDIKVELVDVKAEITDIKAELVDVKAEVVDIADDLAMAREERITYACMTQEWVAKYFLPAAKGGIITEVRDLVTQRVADIAAVGEDTFGAESTISQGNSKLNRGQYKQAYQKYCVALCRASVRNTEVAACGYWD